MPFKSLAQKRYMYAKHPELAKEYEAETPKDSMLPEKVKRKAKAGMRVGPKGSKGKFRGLAKALGDDSEED